MSHEIDHAYIDSHLVPTELREPVRVGATRAAEIPDDTARERFIQSLPAEIRDYALGALPQPLRYDMHPGSITDAGSHNPEAIASAFYGEYCAAVGGKAYNGEPLPDWDDFAADPAKDTQVGAWRAVAKYAIVKFATVFALVLGLLCLSLATGCASVPAAPAEQGDQVASPDPLAAYAVDAELAARLGAAVYLSQRDRLDLTHREAARRAWLALDAVVIDHAAAGEDAPNVRQLLASELAATVPDDALRPLVQELAGLVLRRLEARIPVDQLDSAAAWPVLVAIHDGIAAVLTAHGIDPTVPIQGA